VNCSHCRHLAVATRSTAHIDGALHSNAITIINDLSGVRYGYFWPEKQWYHILRARNIIIITWGKVHILFITWSPQISFHHWIKPCFFHTQLTVFRYKLSHHMKLLGNTCMIIYCLINIDTRDVVLSNGVQGFARSCHDSTPRTETYYKWLVSAIYAQY
jgi:hypothetical protein